MSTRIKLIILAAIIVVTAVTVYSYCGFDHYGELLKTHSVLENHGALPGRAGAAGHFIAWAACVAFILFAGVKYSREVARTEEAREELLRNRDRLAEMVADRTLELDRKNAELEKEIELQNRIGEELESSRKRYSTLVDNLRIGVFRNMPGMGGKFLMANRALAEMHGYDSAAELIGKEAAIFYSSPLERKEFSDELLEKGRIKDREIQLVRRDGATFWASVTASVVCDENGEPRFFDGTVEDITEQKKAAEQITIYEKFIEASGQGFGMAALDGSIIYGNPKLCEMVGINKEKLAGQNFLDQYPVETREKLVNEVLPAVMSRGQWSGEMEIYAHGGTISTLENYFLIEDDSGRPLCIADVITDITGRKRIERELKVSTERFRSISESAHDGIVVMSPDGSISFWNPAAEEIFGYSKDEAMWYELHELLAPERYRVFYKKGLSAFKATGEGKAVGKTLELVGRRKNGEEFPMELSLSRIDIYGSYGAVGIIRDITRRKEMEESNRLLASIVENSQDAIIGKDTNCNIVSWNRAAEKMYGYKAEEVIGRHIAFLTPEEHKDECGEVLNEALSGISVENFETQRIRKDGSLVDVSINLSPIKDEKGELKGISVIARDITERKKIDRMKNEFISTVSHELRTPLTSLRGSLGLLAGGVMGELPPDASEMIEIASSNTDRLVRLINDILDLQKMENGRIEMQIDDISLGELVNRSVEEMSSFAAEKSIKIECDVSDTKIKGDFDRLLQVTDNLLSNAIKFSREGSAVKVRASADGGMATVSVADSGPGIPESFRDRIFEKFQQADASNRKEKGGTGLGLAICKTIIENHGGEIWYESEEGRGATFFYSVECAEEAPAGQAVRAADDDDDDGQPGGGLAKSVQATEVLVIDDDPGVQRLLRRIFERQGYNVSFAMDSISGLAAANSRCPDVIILDVCLPDASGFDILKSLKDDRATREIPVIMLSGAGPDYYSEISSPPVIEWLTKPVDINRLLDCIRCATRRPGPSRVLVVDDDRELLKLMKTTLECRDIEIETAENGAEGFRKVRDFEPDLVILDVLMPGTDGFFLAGQMRSDPAFNRIPVAVYTAKDLTPAEKKKLGLYMTEFFTKLDIDENEFSERIMQMMNGLLEPAVAI